MLLFFPMLLELMLCNRNVTRFDILTLLSSDCRAWALKLSEHLNKQIFLNLHFANTIFIVVFFCTFFLTYYFFICSIFTKYIWWIPFKKISKTVIKLVKNQIFKKLTFPGNQLSALVFLFFFTRTSQDKSSTNKYLAVEQRQDQHKFNHVWTKGVISFVLREIQMWTQVS